jgi:1-hydroxycarotenoid 3,4-desaturase
MSGAPKRVVVVGAGLAGLATAIRLAAEGVQVTVVERGTRPGIAAPRSSPCQNSSINSGAPLAQSAATI